MSMCEMCYPNFFSTLLEFTISEWRIDQKKKISITLPLPIASLYGPQYIWVNVNCFKPFDQNKFSPALQSWLSIRLSSTVSPQLNWILANDFSTVELVNPCLFKCEMKHIHYVIVYGHLAFEVIADIYSDSFFFAIAVA